MKKRKIKASAVMAQKKAEQGVETKHNQDPIIKYRPVTRVKFDEILSTNISKPDERNEYTWEQVKANKPLGDDGYF